MLKRIPPSLHYIAILGNTNHSIRWVNFGHGYKVEPIDVYDLIDLLCDLYDLPEHEVHYKIEANFGYERPKRTIYIIKKEWNEWPYSLSDSEDDKGEDWIDEWMSSHRLMEIKGVGDKTQSFAFVTDPFLLRTPETKNRVA